LHINSNNTIKLARLGMR